MVGRKAPKQAMSSKTITYKVKTTSTPHFKILRVAECQHRVPMSIKQQEGNSSRSCSKETSIMKPRRIRLWTPVVCAYACMLFNFPCHAVPYPCWRVNIHVA